MHHEKTFKVEKNCLKSLFLREYCHNSQRRYSLDAFKSVCLQVSDHQFVMDNSIPKEEEEEGSLQEHYKYKKVWEKTSLKNISSECGRIYFDNYTKVYGGYGKDCTPKQLYTLKSHKVENALTCTSRMMEARLPYEGEKDCVICITKHSNILLRVHLTSGRILQQIFLSELYNFRDISWNETQTSVVVRSTKTNNQGQTDIVKVLAVFDVKPLEFVGMMKIRKKEFGKNTLDAGLCQNVLFTMHQQSVVNFYSFQHVLDLYRRETCKLNDVIDDEGNRLGQHPVGLKFNIDVTECPPILFTVSCYDHLIEFSNHPFHYLFSPAKSPEYFEVHSLESRSLIENGKLRTGVLDQSVSRYRAVFWDDDAGRVLHIASSEISFYNVASNSKNGERMLKKQFDLSLKTEEDKVDIPFTSSGRRISRPSRLDSIESDEEMTIYNVDYEDDLDLICVTAVYQNYDEPKGVVNFYDNKTGKLLKEINIEEPTSAVNEHRTFIDLDTIVQINKSWSGNYHCIMYRLSCDMDDKQEVRKGNISKHIQTPHHRTRRRNR